MADPPKALALSRIKSASKIPVPNATPYTHITVALVAWNEEERLEPLLNHLRPYFAELAVAVQESQDDTYAIAARLADILVTDEHRGYGDATFGPRLMPQIKTRWTLKIDCDEWPDEELLGSLSSATWYAEHHDMNGVWLPFKSSVDGIPYKEQHSHLRLFETSLGWPHTLHSRPMTDATCLWRTGHINHDRSLDEMIQDYLRYWRLGRGNTGWDSHNEMMLKSACEGTAAVKGWDYVKSFSWWPDVEKIAF